MLCLRLTLAGRAAAGLRGVSAQVLGTTPKRPPALCSESRSPSHTCQGSGPGSEPGLSARPGHCVCPEPCVLRNVCCHRSRAPTCPGRLRASAAPTPNSTQLAPKCRGLSGRQKAVDGPGGGCGPGTCSSPEPAERHALRRGLSPPAHAGGLAGQAAEAGEKARCAPCLRPTGACPGRDPTAEHDLGWLVP